jgi:hypothetical protein
MSIFRSTNPLDFNQVDGIVINETAPAPSIQGVGTGLAILVGQFERGLPVLSDVTSTADLYNRYGLIDKGGLTALANKKFSALRLVRVVASDAVVASKTFSSSATVRITFTAKRGKGAYGNNITVTIAAGTTSGSKYTITDTSPGATDAQEVYDNVVITAAATAFLASNMVTATVQSTAAEPSTAAATALAAGADGTVADTDYQTAIALCAVEGAGNFLFLDAYNSTRNGYLKAHRAATQDKLVICAGPQADAASDAITAVASLRDTDGGIVYSFPWIQTVIGGVLVYTSPASWYASILSQTAPNVDPASADNVQFLAGVTGMSVTLDRATYILLKNAGISAFEYDGDLGGYKVKSGIVTQIADSSKLTVARRRMADFLTVSVGKFLKLYQNGQNARAKRNAVKGAILGFIKQQEDAGILPKDSEVTGGKAKIVDTEVLNTNVTIAAGYFKILYRQRIFSSMRFIVLQAEIGESVVVTDVG